MISCVINNHVPSLLHPVALWQLLKPYRQLVYFWKDVCRSNILCAEKVQSKHHRINRTERCGTAQPISGSETWNEFHYARRISLTIVDTAVIVWSHSRLEERKDDDARTMTGTVSGCVVCFGLSQSGCDFWCSCEPIQGSQELIARKQLVPRLLLGLSWPNQINCQQSWTDAWLAISNSRLQDSEWKNIVEFWTKLRSRPWAQWVRLWDHK